MTPSPRRILTHLAVVVLLGGGTAFALRYSNIYPSHVQGPARTRTAQLAVAPQRPVVAPDGVFFLTERVVLTESSGITALVPGTAVRLISTKGKTCRVTDGKVAFDVSKEKLMTDINKAALLAGNDLVSHEAIAAQLGSGQQTDEFKTIKGKIYKNAAINRVEPDGIILVSNSGISKIYFTELSRDVQERFHYDPETAEAYSSAQAANQEALQKQTEETRRKIAEQNKKYWAARETAANQPASVPAATAAGLGSGEQVKIIAHGNSVDINKHLALGRVTIVDFYADWCGPCRQVSPDLEQMANTDPEIALRKIDIVNWKSPVAMQYSLHSIPQVNVYNRRGNLVGTVNGANVEKIKYYVAQAKTSG